MTDASAIVDNEPRWPPELPSGPVICLPCLIDDHDACPVRKVNAGNWSGNHYPCRCADSDPPHQPRR